MSNCWNCPKVAGRGHKTLQNQFAMAAPVGPEDRHKRDLTARASESIDNSGARAGKVYSRRGKKILLSSPIQRAVASYCASGKLGSESRRLIVKRFRAPALLIRQLGYSSEAEFGYLHLLVVTQLLSLRFLHELLIKLLSRFIQSPYRFKRQTRQFFLF